MRTGILFCMKKKVKLLVIQSWPTLWNPKNYKPPASSIHENLLAKILEWVAFPFSWGSSQPRSPTLQADSLPAEPQGKPRNTGVDSHSPSPGDLLTQESNPGLLHCRETLYQLSYEGSPITYYITLFSRLQIRIIIFPNSWEVTEIHAVFIYTAQGLNGW